MCRHKFKMLLILPTIIIADIFFGASKAFAYLDLGTGSAILQGLIGAVAVIAIFAKVYWDRLMQFLGLKKKVDKTSFDPDTVKKQDD